MKKVSECLRLKNKNYSLLRISSKFSADFKKLIMSLLNIEQIYTILENKI